MGTVYRASHVSLKRECAVKVLYGDMCSDRRMGDRFEREADILSQLSHPNVVSIFDAGTTKAGLKYIAMELVKGPTLAKVLRKEAPLSPDRALNILHHLACGLSAIHRANYVHRDIKPSNIILQPQVGREHAKILDFGLGALADRSVELDRLTHVHVSMGTPRYMAPEQFATSLVGPEADLYALGVILYEMIAGRPPFVGSSAQAKKLRSPPPPPPQAGGLGPLAQRLMQVRPEDRPQGAEAVMNEIADIQRNGALRGLLAPLPSSETQRAPRTQVVAHDDTKELESSGTADTVKPTDPTPSFWQNPRHLKRSAYTALLFGLGGILALVLSSVTATDGGGPSNSSSQKPTAQKPPTPRQPPPALATKAAHPQDGPSIDDQVLPRGIEEPSLPDPRPKTPVAADRKQPTPEAKALTTTTHTPVRRKIRAPKRRRRLKKSSKAKATSRTKTQTLGFLRIRVRGPGAGSIRGVSVNGEIMEPTGRHKMRPGVHRVQIWTKHGKKLQKDVTVQPGKDSVAVFTIQD